MPYTERVTAEYFTQIGSQLNILPDRVTDECLYTESTLHTHGYSWVLYTERLTAGSFIQRGSQLGPLYREAHSWVLYTQR